MKKCFVKKSIVLGIILLFVGAGILPSISAEDVWVTETVDSLDYVGMFDSLELTSDNKPHISYWDNTNGDLKYAKWTGTDWLIETVDSAGDVGMYTSLCLDSNNKPHISYYDYTNYDLKYAKWSGTSWIIETVDSEGEVGHFTSIDLDSTNYPQITYYDSSNGDLKYAKWTGTDWLIETVDSAGDVGLYTSLCLDSNNKPHISYYDYSNGDLKYAKWTGTDWSIEVVDFAGFVDYGQYFALLDSLALDSQNRPHIAYHDWNNRDLKYAQWSGTTWVIETVDSAGLAGMYPSIALNSNDQPYISHYEGDFNDLKYAKWTGSSWFMEIVESTGGVGHFSSIAVDSEDKPHISYHEMNTYDLKYAKLITLEQSILIDIKPGSYPNSINRDSKGKVPVAILTTDDIDAQIINPNSIRFLDASPIMWAMEDIDYDGDSDMILHFNTKALNLNLLVDEGEEFPYAYLTGETIDGTSIRGKDTVRLINPLSFELFNWLFQRFPHAFPLLRHLTGY